MSLLNVFSLLPPIKCTKCILLFESDQSSLYLKLLIVNMQGYLTPVASCSFLEPKEIEFGPQVETLRIVCQEAAFINCMAASHRHIHLLTCY